MSKRLESNVISDSPRVSEVLQRDGTGVVAPHLEDLRVLLAVDSRFPSLGGAENQALKLAFSLRQRGVFVEFVAPQISQNEALAETFHGFTITRLSYLHIRWLGSILLMFKFARYLIVNRHRFDALHIHITHLFAASAGFVRRWIDMPVTTKISGFYEFEGGVLDQRRRFMPLNFIIRKGLKRVDFIQTISTQTREKLLGAGFRDEQICFVPNGIDTSQPPEQPEQSDPVTIGYCGRLRSVKGVHVLLDGFALVLQESPELSLRLVIAGDGEQRDQLQMQCRALGIADHVEWKGVIEDTASFFRSIDIYVQPSFAEGLPNSVMEAMVEQRPVIASDIGGNNDLVEHGVSGLLFTPGEAARLAGQIKRMIDEPELRFSMAREGRSLIVERYGFDRVIGQLVELYRA